MTENKKAAQAIALALIDKCATDLPSALYEVATIMGREVTMTFSAKPLIEDVDVSLSLSPKVVIDGETVVG